MRPTIFVVIVGLGWLFWGARDASGFPVIYAIFVLASAFWAVSLVDQATPNTRGRVGQPDDDLLGALEQDLARAASTTEREK